MVKLCLYFNHLCHGELLGNKIKFFYRILFFLFIFYTLIFNFRSANAKWNTPSFSIPSFSINNPINLDNSPGSLQPIKRLSSSKLPYDPHHHHTNHYIHKMVTPEVASIYHTILKDKIWSKFEEDDLIGDNVSTTIDRNLISFGGCWLIVTSKYPFIALHGTRSWHSLFGYSDILKPLSSSIIGLTELFDSDCKYI